MPLSQVLRPSQQPASGGLTLCDVKAERTAGARVRTRRDEPGPMPEVAFFFFFAEKEKRRGRRRDGSILLIQLSCARSIRSTILDSAPYSTNERTYASATLRRAEIAPVLLFLSWLGKTRAREVRIREALETLRKRIVSSRPCWAAELSMLCMKSLEL